MTRRGRTGRFGEMRRRTVLGVMRDAIFVTLLSIPAVVGAPLLVAWVTGPYGEGAVALVLQATLVSLGFVFIAALCVFGGRARGE